MIVDLLRNDLGRICEPGSITVPQLYEVEDIGTAWQMTSTVEGTIKKNLTFEDVLKNIFPCGSVTGTPKIRSMRIIHDLEQTPRGVYTGMIGYIAPDKSMAFNVAIRTLELREESPQVYAGTLGIGSGIVYDSIPEQEYAECMLKAKYFLDAHVPLALIETMKTRQGQIEYLDKHLVRLAASATFFGIPYSEQRIKQELSQVTGDVRVRLLVHQDGAITVEQKPLPVPAKTNRIVISQQRTHSENIFLVHKMTLRKFYDDEYARFAKQGYFDVLFCNERGELTEGAISNLFVKINGILYTPPVSCGLLPGIQRQILLEQGAQEKILYPDDLSNAEEIILTNSVRGITRCSL
jgi:para-aminobenzoate synthetase/4-amino-4-deoxychorismate lyase